MPVSNVNARLAAVKNDTERSRQRASEAASKETIAKQKVAEAVRHMGIVARLLNESKQAHEDAQDLLYEGHEKVLGNARKLATILEIAVSATDPVVAEAAAYEEAYRDMLQRASHVKEGLDYEVGAVSEFLSDIRGRSVVIDGLTKDTLALGPAAAHLKDSIDGRQIQ